MKHDSGRSLVETIAYIGLVGAVIVGVFRYAGMQNDEAKRAAAKAQILALADEGRLAMFGGKINLDAIRTPLYDQWGREIGIAAAECLEISLDLEPADCVALARDKDIRGDCGRRVVVEGGTCDTGGATRVIWFYDLGVAVKRASRTITKEVK